MKAIYKHTTWTAEGVQSEWIKWISRRAQRLLTLSVLFQSSKVTDSCSALRSLYVYYSAGGCFQFRQEYNCSIENGLSTTTIYRNTRHIILDVFVDKYNAVTLCSQGHTNKLLTVGGGETQKNVFKICIEYWITKILAAVD